MINLNTNYKFDTYWLIFALGVFVRIWSLGAEPLTDHEATWALQALSVSKGESVSFGAQPAYIFLTGLLFWLLESSNFLSRSLPALAGSMLLLIPYLLRDKLGHTAALLITIGLAIDPGLVSLSRNVGGVSITICCLTFAVYFFGNKRFVLTGLFLGLFLLAGPDMLHGIIILVVTWVLVRLNPALQKIIKNTNIGSLGNSYVTIGFVTVGTILIIGTILFRYPQGIGAWAASLPFYIQTWLESSGVPALRFISSLVIYQPLTVFFGAFGIFRIWRNIDDPNNLHEWLKILSLGVLTALVLSVIRPGRQMEDMGWVLLPLWVIAGLELDRYLSKDITPRWVSLGMASVTFVFLTVFRLQLASLSQVIHLIGWDYTRIAIFLALLSLEALVIWLFLAGWSWSVVRHGLVSGISAAIGIYMLSVVWGFVPVQPGLVEVRRYELWMRTPIVVQADLLEKSLKEITTMQTSYTQPIQIVSSVDVPSIRWLLRDYNHVEFIPENLSISRATEAGAENPSILLTRLGKDEPALSVAYRGQDISWWIEPEWTGVLPPELLRWFIFRQTTWSEEQVILWIRGDLFPGGSLEKPIDLYEDEIDPLLEKPAR